MIAFPAPPIAQANFSNDQIITLQEIVNYENGTFGFPPNFVWQIDNEQYTNPDGYDFEILPAGENKFRTDIAYLTNQNTIEYLAGFESGEAPQTPQLPVNSILLCTWNIFDATITEPAIMPDSSGFVKKSFSSEINIAGSPLFIILDSPNGSTAFNFTSNNTSNILNGFKTPVGYLYSYDGKLFSIKNSGLNSIELAHGQSGSYGINIPFSFKNASNVFINPKELKYFRFSVLRGLELIENDFGYNVSLGVGSDRYSDTDAQKVSIGYYAGYNSYASNNVNIGAWAGYNSKGSTKCIFIGFNSGINNQETANQVISIGALEDNAHENIIVFNTTEQSPTISGSNYYVFKANEYTLNIKATDRDLEIALPKNNFSRLASDMITIADSSFDPATINQSQLDTAYPDAEDGMLLAVKDPNDARLILYRYFGVYNKWFALEATYKLIT